MSIDVAMRERVQQAYSPELLRELAHSLSAKLATHFETIERGEGPVLNWNLPETNLEKARTVLSENDGSRGATVSELQRRFDDLVQLALSRGHNLHHPSYIGHQVPASVPIAGLFDALGAITNQVMAVYEMGPWATAVERALIDGWGETIGFEQDRFGGLITHGGSLANLTGLLTARNVMLGDVWERGLALRPKPPVLVAHADAHYGIARSAGILGIGTENIVRVGLDDRRRMDPQQLDEELSQLRRANVPIIAVSSCACATPIGAFDPLNDIADICAKHEVWLHVDAAHGGAVSFSRRHRHLIAGLERAESAICDAHKMLFVPALCAFVFYRDASHRFETFRQDAPYLFDPSSPGLAQIDSGLVTVECTKRAAAFGLWGLWSMFGVGLFEDLIDVTFATARRLYEKLVEAPDFEPLHEPECNIVAFRFQPREMPLTVDQIGELNRTVRRRLIESGRFYIVQTTLNGTGALRVSVMNPLTNESHLDGLLDAIRQLAKEIIEKS